MSNFALDRQGRTFYCTRRCRIFYPKRKADWQATRYEEKTLAEVAELADARGSKSRPAWRGVGSTPTFGILLIPKFTFT